MKPALKYVQLCPCVTNRLESPLQHQARSFYLSLQKRRGKETPMGSTHTKERTRSITRKKYHSAARAKRKMNPYLATHKLSRAKRQRVLFLSAKDKRERGRKRGEQVIRPEGTELKKESHGVCLDPTIIMIIITIIIIIHPRRKKT